MKKESNLRWHQRLEDGTTVNSESSLWGTNSSNLKGCLLLIEDAGGVEFKMPGSYTLRERRALSGKPVLLGWTVSYNVSEDLPKEWSLGRYDNPNHLTLFYQIPEKENKWLTGVTKKHFNVYESHKSIKFDIDLKGNVRVKLI